MKNKAFIICVMSAVLLAGCTKSNIVSAPSPAEPVFETQEGIVLDWSQINNDMDEEFVDNSSYPMALSVNYKVEQEQKTMDLTLIVKAGTMPEEAVEFADAAMRYLNDTVAMQDFSYERSSDTSYGGFFKEYSVNLIVMPDATMLQPQYWLVEMSIPAGSDEKIVPKEGAQILAPVEEEQAEAEETADTEDESQETEEILETEETKEAE